MYFSADSEFLATTLYTYSASQPSPLLSTTLVQVINTEKLPIIRVNKKKFSNVSCLLEQEKVC
jgi:hypothetical protein